MTKLAIGTPFVLHVGQTNSIGIQNPVFRLAVADLSQEFRVQTLSGKVRPAHKNKEYES